MHKKTPKMEVEATLKILKLKIQALRIIKLLIYVILSYIIARR